MSYTKARDSAIEIALKTINGEALRGTGNIVINSSSVVTQTFSGNGVQTAFTLASTPDSLQSLEVFISGVRQSPTADYTFSGTTLTFVAGAPISGTNNVFVRWITSINSATPSDGSVTQVKIDSTYESTLLKSGTNQTITGVKRGTIVADNDLSFDMNASNNFSCTTSGTGTLTFTNITSGQAGFILLTNSSNHTIAAAATTKISSLDLSKISSTGTYLMSYFSNGTNVYCVVSGAL